MAGLFCVEKFGPQRLKRGYKRHLRTRASIYRISRFLTLFKIGKIQVYNISIYQISKTIFQDFRLLTLFLKQFYKYFYFAYKEKHGI